MNNIITVFVKFNFFLFILIKSSIILFILFALKKNINIKLKKKIFNFNIFTKVFPFYLDNYIFFILIRKILLL